MACQTTRMPVCCWKSSVWWRTYSTTRSTRTSTSWRLHCWLYRWCQQAVSTVTARLCLCTIEHDVSSVQWLGHDIVWEVNHWQHGFITRCWSFCDDTEGSATIRCHRNSLISRPVRAIAKESTCNKSMLLMIYFCTLVSPGHTHGATTRDAWHFVVC